MKITLAMSKKETKNLMNVAANICNICDHHEDGKEIKNVYATNMNLNETHRFCGGVCIETMDNGAAGLEIELDEPFVIKMFGFMVKVAKKVYPMYNTIKGVWGMISGGFTELIKEFDDVVKPFQPTIEKVMICRYTNRLMGIMITFEKVINNFGEVTIDHLHILQNDSGIEKPHQLLKGKTFERFVIPMETIRDPEKVADKEYIKERRKYYDDGIITDLQGSKKDTKESDEE